MTPRVNSICSDLPWYRCTTHFLVSCRSSPAETLNSVENRPASGNLNAVATPLVTLHVAANAECLAAARLRALERLLASVRVAVDAETARAAEGLVAGLADVTVLALGEEVTRSRVEIVVVLPRDCS